MNKTICVIPARSGSKRLINKNIKLLNDKPLIYYTIKTALETNLFKYVYVATDSEEIAEISKKYGAQVPVLIPEQLCRDNIASHIPCQYMVEYLKQNEDVEFENLLCLQPTSPLKNSNDIIKSINMYNNNKYDFLVSSTDIDPHYFHWALKNNNSEVSMYFGDKYMKERIYLEDVYRPNGAIKIANLKKLKKYGHFFGKNLGIYKMPEERSIHIATQFDFDICQFLIKKECNNIV